MDLWKKNWQPSQIKSEDDNGDSLTVYNTVCFKPFHIYDYKIALENKPNLYYLHFTGEEIKFHTDEATCLKSASKILQKQNSSP